MSNKESETHDVAPTQLIPMRKKLKPKNAYSYVIKKNIKKRPKLIVNQQSRSTDYSDPIYLQQLLERSQGNNSIDLLDNKTLLRVKNKEVEFR
ncbi:MAG: hypothetical protein MRQ13_01325 [Candidatus Midichloria sp.]|nr:hypothetical protein [Candidatus Midichloria sp.]